MGLVKGALMATAFTEIADADDMQDATYYTEIENAMWERRKALKQTPASPAAENGETAAGDDIQDHDFWSALQDEAEGIVVDAYDSGDGDQWWLAEAGASDGEYPAVAGDFTTGTAFVYISTAAELWDKVCGDTGGPRRVAGSSWPTDWTDLDDAAYSYGKCQAGDLIGPWLIRDLQVAMSMLFMTTLSATATQGDYYYYSKPSGYFPMRWLEGASSVQSQWDSAWSGWTDFTEHGPYPPLPTGTSMLGMYVKSYVSSSGSDTARSYVEFHDTAFDFTPSTDIDFKARLYAITENYNAVFAYSISAAYKLWNSSAASGNIAYVGGQSSFGQVSSVTFRDLFDWSWDSAFVFPAYPGIYERQCGLKDPKIGIEYEWTNHGT